MFHFSISMFQTQVLHLSNHQSVQKILLKLVVSFNSFNLDFYRNKNGEK